LLQELLGWFAAQGRFSVYCWYMYLEDYLPLSTLNLLCAIGGLVLLGIVVVLLYDYLWNRRALYTRWLAPVVWPVIIGVTIGSIALSLVYSEYFGFVPCSLCWLQRIALYPQALFALMAFRIKEQMYFPLYSAGLSLFGLVVAVYHYIYQLLPQEVHNSVMPCLADGSASCADKIMNVFGFVTFPFLSAVTFAFLIVVYLNMRKDAQAKKLV
jgi:disulfide bond formation protein DsbB